MPFSPYSGVNARLLSGLVAVDPTRDLVTPTGNEFITSMAGFVSFKINGPREGGKVLSAGSPADAQLNIAPRRLRGGIVDTTIDVEGIYDGDQGAGLSSDARFQKGAFLVVHLIVHVGSGWGYYRVPCVVAEYSPGSKISSDPASFTAKLEVDGVLPFPTFT